MKDLFTFMENNPWLTCILVCLIGLSVVETAKYIAYAVSRNPPPTDEDDE